MSIPLQQSPEKPPLERQETNVTEKTHVDVLAPKDEVTEFPDGGLRAWLIVLGALSTTTATFGVVNSWGVFQTYYNQTLLSGSSPSAVSWIGSVQYALTFFPGIFTGRMFDLGYFRIPMFCYSASLLALTFLVAECTQYWHFILCQGIGVGIFSGVLFGPSLGCLAHWFKKRRSTAYGIVACGSSLGGTVFPILIRNLIPIVGFRWTMRIFGFVLLVFLGIANLTLRRRLPVVRVSGGLFNIRLLKHPPFAMYIIAGFFCFLGQYTGLFYLSLRHFSFYLWQPSLRVVLTYIDSSAVSYGVSETLAFYLVAIANASSALGRIFTGLISDRIGPMNSMMPLTAIAAGLTYSWPYARTPQTLIVIAVFYGISSGAFVGLLPIPVINMGETSDVGRRQGIMFSLLAIGAILGPPISGLVNTATHGYTAVGFYAGTMILAGVGIMFISRGLLLGHFSGGKA